MYLCSIFKSILFQFRFNAILLTFVSLLLFSVKKTYGQLEAGYSLYRFNPQVLSPAHSGSTATSEVMLMNRQQWLGFYGAPKTHVFSGNFKYGAQIGIGVNAMLDQAGPLKITSFSSDYAYHTKLSKAWSFSGGIRAGLANLALNFDDMNLVDQNDPTFVNRSTMKFNTGWGLKITNGDGFFVSISQPCVLKYGVGTGFNDFTYLYGMVGTKFKANGKVIIYPSALFRTASSVPLSWDANVLVNLISKFDLGANYCNQESWGVRAGVRAAKNIYFGYAFEMPTSQSSKVNAHSHEIALCYSLAN